jgi:hypothetical protein
VAASADLEAHYAIVSKQQQYLHSYTTHCNFCRIQKGLTAFPFGLFNETVSFARAGDILTDRRMGNMNMEGCRWKQKL